MRTGSSPSRSWVIRDGCSRERYQIDAKADGNANRDQMFLMLQSLLESRFQLKTHRETRDLPVYALVAARSGLKLPPPKEGGCVDCCRGRACGMGRRRKNGSARGGSTGPGAMWLG